MRVSAVIVNWNGWRETRQCVESLRKQTYKRLRIVVVDNGSDRREKIAGCETIYLPVNRGYAAGVNAGVAWTGGELLLILNNDVVVDGQAVARMVAKLRDNPEAMGVGPVVYDPLTKKIKKTWAEVDEKSLEIKNRNNIPVGLVPAVAFCAILLRRDKLVAMDGLDERYFHYFEDNDFFIRAAKLGWRFAVADGAWVWHAGEGSMKSGSRQGAYYMVRNKLMLLKKFGRLGWGDVWRAVRVNPVGAADFYLGRWGKRW